MFSQWATKRVCKFFMKRLLGRMLRSELDLDQLEVQLGFGTIQLKDLFLNTAYLNSQLGDASVTIKEGSIGSIKAKVPWKVLTAESVEVDVDELKLVVVPRSQREEKCGSNLGPSASDDLKFGDAPQYALGDVDTNGLGISGNGAYVGVDDGVRMIAKMVERVLLRLRVRITNMIIVFDEHTDNIKGRPGEDDNFKPVQIRASPYSLLIARIAYVEYGVEAPPDEGNELHKATSTAEPSILVKDINFKGATVEVVDVQDNDVLREETDDDAAVDVPITRFLGEPAFLVAGDNGGLSGSVQLSVPWKDGTADVPKVHADVVVGRLKLNLSPTQIQQVLRLAKAFKRDDSLGVDAATCAPAPLSSLLDTNGISTGSHFPGTNPASERGGELLKASFGSTTNKNGKEVDTSSYKAGFLPVTRFISDWMQGSGREGQRNDVAVAETDLAASVDEFFECYDGTRSSQASGSSSGMWNWTRSAFGAITAASSLASGSIFVPFDPPKLPEYSLNTRLEGISLTLHYDHASKWNCPLEATRASELWPLKDVSAMRGQNCRNSRGPSLQESISLEASFNDFLDVELTELDVNVTVLGCQTDFNATVRDLEVFEVVQTGGIEDVQMPSKRSLASDEKHFAPNTHFVQSSLENALSSFPASLTSTQSSKDTPCKVGGRTSERGASNSRQPLEKKTESKESREKRCLLRISSESDHAVRLAVSWQLPSLESRNRKARAEISASLQPVVTWVDVYTLKRAMRLLELSSESRSTGPSSSLNCYGHSESIGRVIHDEERRQGSETRNDALESAKDNAFDGVSFDVKLVAPCVRVFMCFPDGCGARSSGLQKGFFVFDINATSPKLGTIRPLLLFQNIGDNKPDSRSLGSMYSLQAHIGDITGTLCSTNEGDDVGDKGRSIFFTTDKILTISPSDSNSGSWPSEDRQFGQDVSIEYQWAHGAEISTGIAKRAWDRLSSQQRQAEGGRGIGGSNSEFAAATTAAEAVEEENAQLRNDLLASSGRVVRLTIPKIAFSLSKTQYSIILELSTRFVDALTHKENGSRGEDGGVGSSAVQGRVSSADRPSAHSMQTSLLVQCGRVDIALNLMGLDVPTLLPRQSSKPWDVLHLNLQRLQVLSVLGVGGYTECSYLWVHHEDSDITGSFLAQSSTATSEGRGLSLLSCKRGVLGRGDGRGGNALAAGKAGLTITHMVWPGHERLGDALLIGVIRGTTLVAHNGSFDWMSALGLFFNTSNKLEDSEERNFKSALIYANEVDAKLGSTTPSSTRTVFLLDFHDVALCYEPGSQAMLGPGVRTGRNSLGRETPPATESSSILAPVACVVAAAAMRVSSSVTPRVRGEQYDIWLRDVALHLSDTSMRKQTAFDYTSESMHRIGHVQIAKEAVMEALVTIDGESGLQWEVECANNQLRFDTCQDTTAAFGRLVAQIQQLFAPEIEPQNANVNLWKADGRSSEGESPRFRKGMDVESDNDTEEANSINLFEGVLEDAFSRIRSSHSSVTEDDEDVDLPGETFTVVNGPNHSRASSIDRQEFLEPGKQESNGQVNRSEPWTPQQPVSRPLSEESFEISNTGLPTFIEDYYISAQKHASRPLGTSLSRENVEVPRNSTPSSRQPSRESTSSGGGRDTEGKGVWYAGKSLEVLEDHVPREFGRAQEKQSNQRPENQLQNHGKKVSLPKKYPSSVGRVVLRDLRARWRFYGGSDWPQSRTGQEQRSQLQFSAEESGRQSAVCLEVLLDGMKLQYDTFPAVGLYASRLVVSIQDIGVYDCSNDAPWRRVLGYHRSKSQARESSSQAVKIQMDSVRPDPLAPLEEYRLSLALLPIRLHLDQRHIDFCIEFFSPKSSSVAGGRVPDDASYSVGGVPTSALDLTDANDLSEDALLPFFQICEMRPLTVLVDYLPRRVDLLSLRGGNYAELLNLVTWKGIELNLKHVRAAGVHGWSSLSGAIFGEWLEDISQNQVHKFVRGVGPIRPFYAVGSGAAKLLVLPAEHYKKDRRVFRGMRKGAIAFVRSISLEALGLGAHLAAGAHEILQQTELVLGGAPLPSSFVTEDGDTRSRAVQPGDTREGLQQACESLSQGLERTASSLVGNPLKAYQRGGGAGLAVASALRAAPSAAVAPASAAVGAFHRALLGVRNELDPEKKRESDEKHAGPPPNTRRIR